MTIPKSLTDRSSLMAFILGVLAVTAGVLLHLPMFWMGKDIGFRVVGMPMDNGMILCALMYSRWSTKWSLTAMVGVTFLGLVWVLRLETKLGDSPVLPVALLIIGSNGILAILLPYASEVYPLKVRGRATGWVAACSKLGGVLAQSLSITALVPPLGIAALMIIAPILVALGLIIRYGSETRGLDLRTLDASHGPAPTKAD